MAVAVALTPLVAPKGPGHGAPIDALMAFGIFAVVLWALRSKATLRIPYVIPMTALIVVGLASAMVSSGPGSGVVAGIQEVFLLVWAAALATMCRTPRALGVVLRTWALSATAWAVLLIAAVVTGTTAVSGATGDGGTRARLLFDHPNMAGNYFMISVFVVVASGVPRRWWLRVGACLLLVLAMLSSGSNAALLSLIGGSVVALFLHLRARRGIVTATAVVAMVIAVLGIGWVEVAQPLITAAQQSDNPLLRYSVGRGARSAEARTNLFQSQFELFQQGHLLGIGPANTRAALGDAAATTVKEAHNDYLATLVERGPLGVLALMGLIGAVGARAVRITRRPLPRAVAAAVPVPAALVGACAAFALTAVTHEVLHYRWLWTLFALLAAVHLLARSRSDPGPAGDAATTTPAGAELVRVQRRVR
ncbi:O-antigen ligase family protein [Blastococcus capsensis]|uniref:O-antigen ligase family protein n=1 Tax=Blastococcus capsensis TaxID=1564163 RepID=UPI00253F8580|nr:O-antigen ligase family protein [Blastococcus capsensis]